MYLYSNDFTIADTFTLHTFITNLGPRCASYLKHITLVNWASDRSTNRGYNHSCFSALVSATNLEGLAILGKMGTSGPSRAAKEIYKNAYPWLEAVGMAKGKIDAAVDMLEVSVSNLLFYGEAEVADEERDRRKTEEFKKALVGFLQDDMRRIRDYPRKRDKATS
jgi:hypothetical protein